MRLSIKTKQVLGVTSIVGFAVVVLSGFYLASLARIRLEESRARGELLANAIYQRAREVVAKDARDPNTALRADEGLRSILESSAYSPNVTYAAILDVGSLAIVHSDSTRIGQPLPPYGDLNALLARGPISQIRAIYADGGRTLEIRQPLLMGTAEFGSIHIGVSTLLVQRDLTQSLTPALITAPIILVGASLLAMVLAQLSLRPIHVIRSGLTRLGQGEFGVVVDLPQRDEFGELGDFFNTVSARLSADRPSPATALLAASLANSLGSDKDPLEDAVAIFNPDGKLLFANPAMRATLPPFLTEPLARSVRDLFSAEHPYRKAVEEATASQQSRGPISAYLPSLATDRVDENGLPAPRERLILTHVIDGLDRRPAAVMLVARNLDYMTQVRSSFSYSQKLAALSRLSAGVAHEVKNPLNATVIHLELLKQQLSSSDLPLAMEHLSIITAQIRRLDEVVQGFLRFIRPEDLKLQPVSVASMVDAIMPVVVAEARKYGVDVNVAVPDTLPVVSVDTSVLQRGRLRISAAAVRGRRVEILCEDNGVGIAPEHLSRIFDLYFTTKEGGSGIGLSLVYRAIQLVDGEIEVQSTPGRGTTFRVLLPQA